MLFHYLFDKVPLRQQLIINVERGQRALCHFSRKYPGEGTDLSTRLRTPHQPTFVPSINWFGMGLQMLLCVNVSFLSFVFIRPWWLCQCVVHEIDCAMPRPWCGEPLFLKNMQKGCINILYSIAYSYCINNNVIENGMLHLSTFG